MGSILVQAATLFPCLWQGRGGGGRGEAGRAGNGTGLWVERLRGGVLVQAATLSRILEAGWPCGTADNDQLHTALGYLGSIASGSALSSAF